MNVFLHRFISDKSGTFGLMVMGERPLCVTCEDPWNNNKPNISCIPTGTYKCVPHSGAKYKNVWRLEDVPGRDAILIHNGNTTSNTEGCILVGDSLGKVLDKPAVLNSLKMLSKLREVLPKEFTLTITNLKG